MVILSNHINELKIIQGRLAIKYRVSSVIYRVMSQLMNKHKPLTIIIVAFNSIEIIEQCLVHLNTEKYDVIVVDNASLDGTSELVSSKFPKVNLIRSEKNLGYGRANNVGLMKANTEYSLVLNPDAVILEEDIEVCLQVLDSHPLIALANPKILERLEEVIPETDTQLEDIKFAHGGVLFMRMSVFREIGFFDEEIFMFGEDNEISDRSISHNYRNVAINNAKSLHLGGASSKKNLRNTYRRFWHLGWSKSRYRIFRKGKLQAIRSTIRLVIVYFVESIFYLITGNLDKSVSKIAFSIGCFSHLIGLKAFNANGDPRG